MSPAPSLLRIGPFSRLAHVTIKALRFYDDADVFRPIWVDPGSGYRYYSTIQLPLLHRIRALRDLGCSVAEIRQLALDHRDRGMASLPLSYPDPGWVARLRRRLMVEAAIAEQRLQQLDSLMAVRSRSTLPLVSRRIDSTAALTIRDCVRPGGDDIHRMFESAERLAARRGVRTDQSPFLLLHDMKYGKTHTDVEACIPVRRESLGSAGVRLIEPVTHAACLRFSGNYDQAPALLDAALDTLGGTDARIAGPIREVYLRFGADQRGYRLAPRFIATNVSQYRTELQVPLRR